MTLENNMKNKNKLIYSNPMGIFLFNETGTDVCLQTRVDTPTALTMFNGTLYDGDTEANIRNTTTKEIIGNRKENVDIPWINSMINFDGKLLDATESVYETFSGNKLTTINNEINLYHNGYTNNEINALAKHNNKLYMGCFDGTIMEFSTEGKYIAKKYQGTVDSLVSFNNTLYASVQSQKKNTSQIMDVTHDKLIQTREGTLRNLCVFNGELYDGGKEDIRNSLTNEILTKETGDVMAMCEIPQNTLYKFFKPN